MDNNTSLDKSESRKEFSSNVIIWLLLIGGIGLILRISFIDHELPLNSDNFLFFRYTIDLIVGYDSPTDVVSNNGWPLFLYPFFSILQSNNFMDYMILQKCLSISLSVLTIIPLYYLCKQFFEKKFAIIGTAIFVFEPRIIQNSLFGVTEPLYIILLTTSVSLFFSNKNYFQYISFAALTCATLVRTEALFIIPVFYLMFFVKNKINKKSILNIIIISLIIMTILIPTSILRSEQMGTDGLTDRVSGGMSHVSSINQNDWNMIFSFFIDGLINMIKFLGWAQIPYLILFVPVGFVLFLKDLHFKHKTLLVIGFVSLIPSLYTYSFASDSRYLFVLYPLFCIVSVYAIRFYSKKISSKKMFFVMIFSVMIILSVFYLSWKSIDVQHEMESYSLAFEISKVSKIVNAYPTESAYLDVIGLTEVSNFPVKSEEYNKKRYINFPNDGIDSFEEFLEYGKKFGMTHVVVDNDDERKEYLKEIFENEKKYPFLTKVFDSKDMGYNYHLKVFKIDYEEIDRLN